MHFAQLAKPAFTERGALKGKGLMKLQARLQGVQYIVIDKLSMISQAHFALVGPRLRHATGRPGELSGAIFIIMMGGPGRRWGGKPFFP